MAGNGLLIQPDLDSLGESETLYRQLMQLVGRDLGLEDWGSAVNHTTYDSDADFAHTIQNQGTGGHLNVPSLFTVTDSGVATAALAASSLTVSGTAALNGDTTLGNAVGDAVTVNGTSVFNAVATMADALVANGDVTLGNASADTLTVNATAILNAAATFNATPVVAANLSFSGNARRLLADLSNATISNRLLVKSSTTNGETRLGAIPDGTATKAGFVAYSSSAPDNSHYVEVIANATDSTVDIVSSKAGTGTTRALRVLFDTTRRAGLSTAGVFDAAALVAGGTALSGSEVLRSVGATRLEGTTSVIGATVDLDNNKSYRASDGTTQRNLAKYDSGGVAQFAENGATGAVVDAAYVQLKYNGTVRFSVDTNGLGFYGAVPSAKPTIVGAKGGNVALANLITALATLGLLIDSTT